MNNPFETIERKLDLTIIKLDKLLNPPKEDYSKKFYSVKEASVFLGVTPQTVINRINAGKIIAKPNLRPYRIPHYQIFDKEQQLIYRH